MKNTLELSEIPDFEPFEGMKAKLVHTKSQTYAFWEIKEGIILPEHKHINEQVSFVTDGELELTIDGKMTIMKKGYIAIIPPNTLHSAKAITRVELTDVFTPIREDFPKHQKD